LAVRVTTNKPLIVRSSSAFAEHALLREGDINVPQLSPGACTVPP
jgi:hypothetical protein